MKPFKANIPDIYPSIYSAIIYILYIFIQKKKRFVETRYYTKFKLISDCVIVSLFMRSTDKYYTSYVH